MDIKDFSEIVNSASAIRRIRKLQPVNGIGGYVSPPTYKDKDNITHVFEDRLIDNKHIPCVLLDSVQSQANRLEEVLTKSIQSGNLKLPHVFVDFTKSDVKDLGIITSINAPHRIFDAIIRDTTYNDEKFIDSEIGKELSSATPRNALALFEYSPTTLIFGGWNSTGYAGGNGHRFQRCIVSEIVGINIEKSKKPSSRLDPLEIEKVQIFKTSNAEWDVTEFPNSDKSKPSEINHGNIQPSFAELGVTMEYALQTTVITFAGLRHLSFSIDQKNEHDLAAWMVLAALAIFTMVGQDKNGYSLRSRCDLIPEENSSDFELIHNDGRIEKIKITEDDAKKLLEDSIDFAKKHDLPWDDEPKKLLPQDNLLKLIKKSREKAAK